ncbi:MAG: acyl carrier protein [Planctomycetota bacterium]
MGLDCVELVIEVEEHFGVTLTDQEVAGARTVGELQAILHQRLAGRRTSACQSLPWFLEVRRMAREAAGDPLLRIKPSTRVVDALGAAERRVLWSEMAHRCNMLPLKLTRPLWAKTLLVLFAIAAFSAGAAAAWIDGRYWPLGLLLAACTVAVSHLVTLPMRTTPPREAATFGHLTRRFVGLEAMTGSTTTVDQINGELREIIVEQLGVDADNVVPSARFVEDLNMQ